jgi:hypothetical protein
MKLLVVKVKNGRCRLHGGLNVDRFQKSLGAQSFIYFKIFFSWRQVISYYTVTNKIIKQQTDLISKVKCLEQESKHVELL